MKFYQLAKGTVLYHGTDAFQNFRVPRYPCWFCEEYEGAALWAGWGSVARGERRVLVLRVDADLRVVDTRSREDWEALCELVGDDTTWGVARKVEELGLGGWYGNTEVLIASQVLEPVEIKLVANSVVPWGR